MTQAEYWGNPSGAKTKKPRRSELLDLEKLGDLRCQVPPGEPCYGFRLAFRITFAIPPHRLDEIHRSTIILEQDHINLAVTEIVPVLVRVSSTISNGLIKLLVAHSTI